MASLLVVRVHLDWTGPEHFEVGVSRPCRVCGTSTCQRDSQGTACHKSCAEDEIARELLGSGRAPDCRRAGADSGAARGWLTGALSA